jgi:hypothetical protein
VFEGVCNTDVTILMIWCFLDCSWSLTLQFIHLVHLEERHFCCQGTHISSMQMQSQFPKCCDSKPRQRRTEGGSTPTPKFRRPSKIMPNSTRLWKLLKIAEFRKPTPQDVRKKVSKILKIPPVRNCFTLAMTKKLVVIINSLKVPEIKKIILYEMTFLVPKL